MIMFALIDSLVVCFFWGGGGFRFLFNPHHHNRSEKNRRLVSLGRVLLTPFCDFTSSFQIQLQDLDVFPNL